MQRLRGLNREDWLIIVSLVLVMGGIILGAILAQPGLYGITTIVVILLLIAGALWLRSERLAWLLVFGLVAGILELWSDWLHVEHLRTLVYTDYFGFRILASPSYMPVGWWLTCVQFGYIALRLAEKIPAWLAVGIVALLGMSLPPWYEEFAAPAKTWYYTTARWMLSHTPVWIILTYGGCMFGIATMALLCYRERAWGRAILAGIFAGAGFMLSAAVSVALLG